MAQRHSAEALAIGSAFALEVGWGQQAAPTPTAGPRLNLNTAADKRKQHLRAIFQTWDMDGNGFITKEELSLILNKLGKMTSQEIEYLMSEADTNKDGNISLEEFIDWLASGDSTANVIVEYGPSLKLLFDQFDKKGNGVISFHEFEEVHGILQGAMRLHPEAEDAEHLVDPLMLQKDAKEAFALADYNSDKNLSFADFAKFMNKVIQSSGISEDQFDACCQKLAFALQRIFVGIKKAEAGLIKEDQSYILEELIGHLAEAERSFEEQLAESSDEPAEAGALYTEPPKGLSIPQLLTMHLKLVPVNLRLVESFETFVICIPRSKKGDKKGIQSAGVQQKHTDDAGDQNRDNDEGDEENKVPAIEHEWVAEVSRKCIFTSGTTKRDKRRYYRFHEGTKRWEQSDAEKGAKVGFPEQLPMEDAGEGTSSRATKSDKSDSATQFLQACKSLAGEIGIFYILKTQADFGYELTWEHIRAALVASVDMGWMDIMGRMAFNEYMEDKVEKQMQSKEPGLSKEELKIKAQEFLHNEVQMRPREVMAILTKLDIVKMNNTWRSFMRAV